MISVSFVNNTIQPIRVNDSLIDIFNTVRESDNSISLLVGDYISAVDNNILNEAVGLDVITEDAMEQKRKGIFEKIGEAILAVYKKIQEFIKRIGRVFQDLIYRLSPIEKKLEMIKKDRPELANKVLAEIEAGNISMVDLKNLTEVDKMYKDILEAAKRKEVDAKTLRGKIEKMKAKFDDIVNPDNPNIKRLQNVATVITISSAILILKTNILKAKKVEYEIGEKSSKAFDDTRKAIKDMEANGYDKMLDPDKYTKLEMLGAASNYMQGNFGKLSQQATGVSHVCSVVMSKVLQVLGQDMNAKEFIDGVHALNDKDNKKS